MGSACASFAVMCSIASLSLVQNPGSVTMSLSQPKKLSYKETQW